MPATELPANVAPFQFDAGGHAFAVEAFRGREAVSEPFRFEVELTSKDPDVDARAVLGAAATLTRFRGDEPVTVHGVVAAFDAGDQTPDRARYRAVLVPRLWRLGLAQQSRVFQDATVPEVVLAVLAGHGLGAGAVRVELAETYPRSEFVVQYQESDLAFVRRLLEREGVWFTFDHGSDVDMIVLADRASSFLAIGDGPAGDADVAFRAGSGLVRDRGEAVDRFAARDHLVPGRVVLNDYNYRTPDTPLEVEADVAGGGPEEVYAFGDHYKTAAEGERLARVRAEALACRARTATGEGDVAAFTAGATFTLAGHPRRDLDGDYLLTAVEHRAARPDTGGDGAPALLYHNTFDALPARAPFRPERATPVPTAPGLMTARTESAGGLYAFVDEEGRYRARLAMDRAGAPDAQATRPLRMAQPYSGPGYGLHLPNHAGTEMLLGFTNGDVDRPVALGTVPNPSQGSPAVAQNRMENVLRSWAGNALVLDDTRAGELVHLTAVKDHTETVADAQTVEVGSAQTITVGTDRTTRVERDQSETIGGDKTISVVGTHGETVSGETTLTLGAGRTASVAEDDRLKVGKSLVTTVGGDASTTVDKQLLLSVGAAADVSVAADAHAAVDKALSVQVGTTTTVDVGDRITIRCGSASITMTSDGDIQISGANIIVKGSGTVKVKGSTITEN